MNGHAVLPGVRWRHLEGAMAGRSPTGMDMMADISLRLTGCIDRSDIF
jgi:hypothetical protein